MHRFRLPSIPLLALLAALALAVAGCGDDEDSPSSAATATEQTETTATETAPTTETTPAETEPGDDGGGITAPSKDSPEDQEGGAGDEVPASSQALVTGNGGKLSPSVVHVPPFIAIRLELRSADGVEYELEGGGGKVKAGGEIETAATTFDGLKAGQRIVLSGPQGKVTIVANAEPGP
jgi:hypothetical protein